MKLARLPATRLTLLFAALTLGPLLALTYLSVARSSDAVEGEASARLVETALVTGHLVHSELMGLSAITESYADRPALISLLESGPQAGSEPALHLQLRQLRRQRPGIAVAFVADRDGRLLEISPATPSIVGRDFSFRDWYQGVTRTGRTYVSKAYVTAAASHERVVATAVPIRGGVPARTLGFLVAGYGLSHVQEFTEGLARDQGVTLQVTDQAGTVVAAPDATRHSLVSAAGEPGVAAALRGRTGTLTRDRDVISAYGPVPELGWTITASVPRELAFARVHDLRAVLLTIAGPLALVLVAGIALLAYTLRRRDEAERLLEDQNVELEAQTAALTETQGLLERALAEARRLAGLNGAILDATADGIVMVDLEGRTQVENSALKRLAAPEARAGEETVWEQAERLAPGTADPDGYLCAMRALQEDPAREALDEYELAGSGTSIQRYSGPVRGDDGTIVGRIFVLRDVTRERGAEHARSQLVATVSHELRTPLTGVLGFAELLAEDDVDEETRRDYARIIAGEAHRLRTLINDFLDLQQAEQSELALSLAPLDLNELVAEQARLYGAQSPAHTIEVALEPGLELRGDHDRIAQVLGNLLTNAIKYSPQGGTVTVTGRRAGAAVRIEVRDEGLGIPAAQQEHVFERFFRVDSSETRRIGGTGLGLALVRQLVEAHGGTVGFASVEGAGSTFWFELPQSVRPGDGEPARGHVLAA